MTSVPRLGIASVLVGLVAGAALVGAAGPAAADTRISNPGDGAVITGSGVTIRASADVFTGRLLVNGTEVDSGTGGLSHGINTHSARNGAYTAVLEQRGLTGLFWHRKDDVRFAVRAAPFTPSGTRVSASGRKVTLRWTRGPEPDLTGYEVLNNGKAKSGSVGSLCSGRACSATVRVPSTVAGRVGFGVRARRASGSGGTVSSGTSVVYVSFPAGGGPGQAAGLPGGVAAPGTGLDPLNGRWPIALPPVTPDGAVNGFQYPTPEPEVAAPVVTPAGGSERSPQLAMSLAIVLVVLLAAAHIGVWTRRMRLASAVAAGVSTGGRRGGKRREGGQGGEAQERTRDRRRSKGPRNRAGQDGEDGQDRQSSRAAKPAGNDQGSASRGSEGEHSGSYDPDPSEAVSDSPHADAIDAAEATTEPAAGGGVTAPHAASRRRGARPDPAVRKRRGSPGTPPRRRADRPAFRGPRQ